MKILFLGGLYPYELYNKIHSRSKRSFQIAANNLQWAFIEGLDSHFDDLTILTAPFISTFPFGYKDCFFKGSQFSHNNKAKDKCINFINIPFIRDWSIKKNLKKEIRKWCTSNNEKKCIVVYSLMSHLMSVATELKKEFSNLIICQIVSDLPEYMGANFVYRKLGLQNKSIVTINKCLINIDCFALLTEYMKDKLKIQNRPWVLIEGMFQNVNIAIDVINKSENTILYTGSLSFKYGIDNLLQAFSMINSPNYKLWICGDGDMKDKIKERALSDGRINYFGILSFDEVKMLQRKATVLINPRTSEGEYTKYSFPSKTMEYLASGTPTIMNKLTGIPEEYYKYAFVPQDETIECLYKTLIDVCNKSQKELNQFGEKASQFILTNKNPLVQVRSIYEMVNKF